MMSLLALGKSETDLPGLFRKFSCPKLDYMYVSCSSIGDGEDLYFWTSVIAAFQLSDHLLQAAQTQTSQLLSNYVLYA